MSADPGGETGGVPAGGGWTAGPIGGQLARTSFVVPALLFIAAVFLIPLLYSLYLSLTQYSMRTGSEFVGLENYARLATDAVFLRSLLITGYFAAVAVAVEVSLAMAIALLLNRRFIGRNFLRAALLVPWAVPWVVNGIMWRWIFNPRFGALNALLQQLGIIGEYQIWLGEPFQALNMMIVADLWKETPFIALLLLTGLQSVPASMYEAARMDGANKIQQFFRITLPLLRPVVFVAVSLRTIWALKTFDLVYALTQGGPSLGTNLLNYHIYTTSFARGNFGSGASMSVIFAVLILLLALLYYRWIFRDPEYA